MTGFVLLVQWRKNSLVQGVSEGVWNKMRRGTGKASSCLIKFAPVFIDQGIREEIADKAARGIGQKAEQPGNKQIYLCESGNPPT
jgi:hypothetical protein